MRAPRLGAALASLALVAAIAGCGPSSGSKVPDVAALPLVKGAAIASRVRECDRGANAYCAIEMVVVDRRFRSSMELLLSERSMLRKLGWTGTGGDTGDERAADSPGHRFRVTYATAQGDLTGIDLGWIKRSRRITLALSQALFDRSPAMAILLEFGAS